MNILNLKMQPATKSIPTFIFIDGSYYCFHRYFALLSWWKLSHPDCPTLEDPMLNEEFVSKFKETFIKNVMMLSKKIGLNKHVKPIMMVAKDCKRSDIWRNEFCSSNTADSTVIGEYKGTRQRKDGFMGVQFFVMAYQENLFQLGGCQQVLYHPHLEADDCIAISVRRVLQKTPDCKIYVITNDKDYLQLAEPRVELINLSYKKLTDQKSCSGDPKCDLFCKIVMGDSSDNIKPIFKTCGLKTALKCFEDQVFFENKLATENAYEKYHLNRKLIDFNEIPANLIEEFFENNISEHF